MRFSDTLSVKIVLLGAGGTGGHIAPHLYRLAYALDREVEIIIVDGDTVERPNLVRQNFCVTDLKQNKARVIAERYSAAFGMEANYVSHYIEDEQELSDLVQCPKIFRPGRARFEEGYTILIGAVDNDKSRVMCHSVFRNACRLYIDSGNGEYQGQVVCGVKLDGRTFNRPLISVFPTVMESEDKDGREIRLSLSYLDQTGTEHTIERRRKDDKMEIALDGRSILQRDLVSMFGDLDEFLALYNPLYFIEILQDGGRKLLEKHLPPMPQESILAQMSETMCTALAGYTFISPEAALVNLRAEKKEIEEALLAYSGRKEMAAEVAIRQADAKNLLSAKIADLQKRADQWEARRTEGLDMKALNLELIEMSDRHNELLQEKPKPFDPAPYRERQAKLREKIEVRRQEIYESKLTEQFAKVEKPLQALLVKFNKTSRFFEVSGAGDSMPLMPPGSHDRRAYRL